MAAASISRAASNFISRRNLIMNNVNSEGGKMVGEKLPRDIFYLSGIHQTHAKRLSLNSFLSLHSRQILLLKVCLRI